MNIKPLLLSAVFVATAHIATVSVQADILSIGSHAQVLKKANLPKHGDSMRSVSSKFGSAQKVTKSKGKVSKRNPRITRWDYHGFTVYFENAHVIHSVVHH